MSSSQKLTYKRDSAAGAYLSEAKKPIPPPLLHTTVYTCIPYTYSHTEGKQKSCHLQYTVLASLCMGQWLLFVR
jgi:hypothetical protein